MLIKKKGSKKFTIPGGTVGWLYPSSPNGDQTIAYVQQDGVYPERGYSLNDVATETIFMLDGCFKLEADGKKHILKEGDMFMVFPGTRYRIRGKGKSMVFITPAWEKNKNKIVKN